MICVDEFNPNPEGLEDEEEHLLPQKSEQPSFVSNYEKYEDDEEDGTHQRMSVAQLGKNRCDDCGDCILKFNKNDSRPLIKRKESKSTCIRYNPIESLKISSDIDESELKEAYKNLNALSLKQRKQDLEFYKYKGFWAWIRGMIIIDEEMMKKSISTDAYIYLLYLKWCAIFLFFLSIMGVLFLCPFYFTGTQETKQATFLQKITVFKIIHSDWRIWIMFCVSMAYSIIGYRFVYNLVIQFKNFRYYKEETDIIETEYEIAKKTVQVKYIPDHYSVKRVNDNIDSVMKENYDGYRSVSTLGRYEKLYDLFQERIDTASELNEHMIVLYQTQGKPVWNNLIGHKSDVAHEKAIPKLQEKMRLLSKYLIFML